MNNIEIKVNIREETKKTKVYDFSESIRALEQVQQMSSAIIAEVNEKICTFGAESFETWINKMHTELKPVINNSSLMDRFIKMNNSGISFGYATFRAEEKDSHGDNRFILSIYNQHNTPRIRIYFLPDDYIIDFSIYYNPETDLCRISECSEFVHQTIMDKISYAIREAKVEAQKRAKIQVETLENLLNM